MNSTIARRFWPVDTSVTERPARDWLALEPIARRYPRAMVRQLAVIVFCLALVAGIAWLEHVTGPYLSFGILYILPVAVCGWWLGLTHGLLVALASAAAGSVIERVDNSEFPAIALVWNGVVRFCTLALITSLLARLHGSMRRERLLARTDPLTGAANGRSFYEAMAREAEVAREKSQPLSLAYLDLDDFKIVNDRLGHAAGDEVLKHFVNTILDEVGTEGLVARVGGDEFALLLPATGPQRAAELTRRVHQRSLEEFRRHDWNVTVSIGSVTFLKPRWDVDRMIQYADALMYAAKKAGKSRVESNIVDEQALDAEGAWTGIERRATARILCDRTTVRVRPADAEPTSDDFAVIRDICSTGVGLHMPNPYPIGTVLVVEPLSCPTRTVLARITKVTRDTDGWLHDGQMATRLSDEELACWSTDSFSKLVNNKVAASVS
jgi:diguanylate cyclase (GGDEF)-like protein